MTGLARIQEIAAQKQREAAQRQAEQAHGTEQTQAPVTIEQARALAVRADSELDRIDALPDSPERDAAFAKVNAWLANEWQRVPQDVRREALTEGRG